MKNIITISDALELNRFMAQVFEGANFQIERVRMDSTSDWSIRSGALSHRTGGFFDVLGLRNEQGEENLMLYQPQSALTGLALCRIHDVPHVLLQARVEPGNVGCVQWGPTIQSTPANFLASHGGRRTFGVDLFYTFSSEVKAAGSSMQLDLGHRYLQKSKWHNYVLLEAPIPAPDHMAWVSLFAILEVAEMDHCLNADLRSLLSVFDWDKLALGGVTAPVRTKSCALFSELACLRNSYRMDYEVVALEELVAWMVTSEGVVPSEGQLGASAHLFHTSCGTREVAQWTQPLICVSTSGRVRLVVRRTVANELECLLRIQKEIGIDGGYLVTATEVFSPGSVVPNAEFEEGGQVIAEFKQSDEGGRFYQNDSTYQLILTNGDWPEQEGCHWVDMQTLKACLKFSNMASIELRCIASLLIREMNASLA